MGIIKTFGIYSGSQPQLFLTQFHKLTQLCASVVVPFLCMYPVLTTVGDAKIGCSLKKF